MSTRNLLNIALIIFISLLVVLVIYEPGKKKAVTPPTLTNLKSSDIQHISITRKNEKQAIEFIKKESGWTMTQPYQQSANTFRIDAILELLSAVSFSQHDLENLNPAEFGLDDPVATITFNKKTRIIFGHNKSLRHLRYIQIGSVLHMTGDTFYYKLAANPENFINHKLLPENSKIIQLTLPAFKLSKTDGRWTISTGKTDYSADAINQLIDEWMFSQAYAIKVKKISTNIKADIKIKFKNKTTMRFTIGNDKTNFTLTNIDNGVSYILPVDRKDKLLKLSSLQEN